MLTMNQPKVVVSAQIERDQREELERLARQEDRTISYLVRQAVDRFLHPRPDSEEER
jgi:predicted transcriptional regulator